MQDVHLVLLKLLEASTCSYFRLVEVFSKVVFLHVSRKLFVYQSYDHPHEDHSCFGREFNSLTLLRVPYLLP